MQFLGHILDRRSATAATHEKRKAFGVKGIIGQPSQTFAFHLAATPAGDPPHEQLQVDVLLATGQVAHHLKLSVVVAAVPASTDSAGCFFWRRWRLTTRACGLPKTPRMIIAGTNPGNRYASPKFPFNP